MLHGFYFRMHSPRHIKTFLPVSKPLLRKVDAVADDPKQIAESVNLIYVTDTEPGIERHKKGKGFIYLYESKQLSNEEELTRIKSLVIPPAWKNVWICRLHNGH